MASIHLSNIQPEPLQGSVHLEHSQIWDTDLSIDSKQKYLVSAASGKGKSTFLHILYGLRGDYTGSVQLFGDGIAEIDDAKWADIRREKLSIVFQDLRLFLDLTVEENIEIKRSLTDAVSAERAKKMATHLGIEPLWDKSAETLSYGQRQRVAIVRALCQPFDLLLLDEPFSHLDDDNIALATDLILTRCSENHAGLILVSLGDVYRFSYDHQLIL